MHKLNILAEYKIMERREKNTDNYGMPTEGKLIKTFFKDDYNPIYKKLINALESSDEN